MSRLDRCAIKTPRRSQASSVCRFPIDLQPNNVVSAIDVQHLAGDAAGKMAKQIEACVSQIGRLQISLQGRLFHGVVPHEVEVADARRASVRIGPALMAFTRTLLCRPRSHAR